MRIMKKKHEEGQRYGGEICKAKKVMWVMYHMDEKTIRMSIIIKKEKKRRNEIRYVGNVSHEQ